MMAERELTVKDRDELAERVLEVYRADPERLRETMPEVADLLDRLASPATILPRNESPFGLTQRERNFHQEALDGILRRFRYLTEDETVAGLEHGANLLADGFIPEYSSRQTLRLNLLKLVRKATGIQPRKTGQPVERVIRQGETSRSIPVVRGVYLHLTWEFKLLKVTMDPHQWRLRCQALSFVGMGRDTATDVAENHDDYLMDAYLNG
jgi:hypothetical protein